MIGLDVADFRQRFPWWGGDLQTIATGFYAAPKKPAPRSEQKTYPMKDGDTLYAMLDSPAEPEAARPLVVLIHGVPGSQRSRNMLHMSKYLVGLGYWVLRLNLRGAGPSREYCRGQYYAGSSRDLAELLAQLPESLTKSGIAVVGYSVGGAILLKYLGEQGSATPIKAAASISAPIDLLGTCRSLMRLRNTPYHWWVFREIKREALANRHGLTHLERATITASSTLWQYDDLFTAPRNGFKDAADYYSRCSAVNFLPDIGIPTLVVASLDDPWVPGSAYAGSRWGPSKHVSTLLLPSRGGHVGFHGTGGTQPWSDRAVAKFLAKNGLEAPINSSCCG